MTTLYVCRLCTAKLVNNALPYLIYVDNGVSIRTVDNFYEPITKVPYNIQPLKSKKMLMKIAMAQSNKGYESKLF